MTDIVASVSGLIKKKQYDKAIQTAREALQDNNQNANMWELLIKALNRNGQFQEALAAAQNFKNIFPDNLNARVHEIKTLGSCGNYKDAEILARKLSDEFPNDENLRHIAANMREEADKHGEASSLPTMRKPIPRQLTPEKKGDEIDRLIEAQKYDKAEQSAQQALELWPDHVQMWRRLIVALEAQNKVADALPMLDKWIAAAPSAVAYMLRARVKMSQGYYKAAEKDIDEAVRLNNTEKICLVAAEMCLSSSPTKALSYAEKIIKQDPSSLDAYVMAGKACMQSRNFERLATLCKNLVEMLDSKSGERGEARKEKPQYRPVVDYLDALLSLSKGDLPAALEALQGGQFNLSKMQLHRELILHGIGDEDAYEEFNRTLENVCNTDVTDRRRAQCQKLLVSPNDIKSSPEAIVTLQEPVQEWADEFFDSYARPALVSEAVARRPIDRAAGIARQGGDGTNEQGGRY